MFIFRKDQGYKSKNGKHPTEGINPRIGFISIKLCPHKVLVMPSAWLSWRASICVYQVESAIECMALLEGWCLCVSNEEHYEVATPPVVCGLPGGPHTVGGVTHRNWPSRSATRYWRGTSFIAFLKASVCVCQMRNTMKLLSL